VVREQRWADGAEDGAALPWKGQALPTSTLAGGWMFARKIMAALGGRIDGW